MDSNYWQRRYGRRTVLRGTGVVGAGLAAAALIGCGDSEGGNGGGGGGGTGANPTTAPGAEPQVGGELRVGMQQGPNNGSLDTNTDGSSIPTIIQSMGYTDTLLIEDADKNLVFHLATSEEWSDDYLEGTYSIRPDVLYHDGTELNAETVQYSIRRIRDTTTASTAKAYLSNTFDDIEVLDDYTVKFKLSSPNHVLRTRFTRGYLGFPSRDAIESMGDDNFKRAPAFTGPFQFKEWIQGSHTVFERNQAYDWAPSVMKHTGPTYVDQISFVELPDAQSRADALEAGDIEIMEEVAPVHVERFKNDNRFKMFQIFPQGGSWSVDLNTQLLPTADIRVRQALAHAINKEEICRVVYFDQNRPATTLIPSTLFGHNPNAEDPYPYDPEKAVELLEGAGWVMGSGGIREKDGVPLMISWVTQNRNVVELIQGQVRDLGIGIDIVIIASDTQLAERLTGATDHASDGGLRATSQLGEDPDFLRVAFISSNIEARGGVTKMRGYLNPQVDELLARTATIPIRDAEREQVFWEAQDLMMADVPRIPIFEGSKFLITKNDVHDIHLWSTNYYWYPYDIWRGEA